MYEYIGVSFDRRTHTKEDTSLRGCRLGIEVRIAHRLRNCEHPSQYIEIRRRNQCNGKIYHLV